MHPCLQHSEQVANRGQAWIHLKLPHPEVLTFPDKAHPQLCTGSRCNLQVGFVIKESPCLTAAAALFSPSLLISAKSWGPAGGALDAAGSPTSLRKPVKLYPSLRAAASATSLEACACRQSAVQALCKLLQVYLPTNGFRDTCGAVVGLSVQAGPCTSLADAQVQEVDVLHTTLPQPNHC